MAWQMWIGTGMIGIPLIVLFVGMLISMANSKKEVMIGLAILVYIAVALTFLYLGVPK